MKLIPIKNVSINYDNYIRVTKIINKEDEFVNKSGARKILDVEPNTYYTVTLEGFQKVNGISKLVIRSHNGDTIMSANSKLSKSDNKVTHYFLNKNGSKVYLDILFINCLPNDKICLKKFDSVKNRKLTLLEKKGSKIKKKDTKIVTNVKLNKTDFVTNNIFLKPINKQNWDKRIAIFTTCNEAYVPYCIITLLSFKKYNPYLDCFIFGYNYSDECLFLMKKYGIKYYELYLYHVFRQKKEDKYPSECFWIFKCPHVLYELGYQYSLGVDGDMYCNQPFNLSWLNELKHIAGASPGSVFKMLKFIKQYDNLDNIFSLYDRKDIQSGLIWFHNKNVVDINIFGKIVNAYDKSVNKGIPRKGDDSLLSLTISINWQLHVHPLPYEWNCYRMQQSKRDYHLSDSKLINTAYVAHFTMSKPWNVEKYSNYTSKYFLNKWRTFAFNTFNINEIKTHLPNLYEKFYDRLTKNCKLTEFNLFWVKNKDSDFSSQITPYLVEKILDTKVKITNPDQTKKHVLLGNGSIISKSNDHIIVWGSGAKKTPQQFNKAKYISCVRGPLTRKRLIEQDIECPPLYCDPAFLLPKFYYPKLVKRYRLGVIPTFIDYFRFKKLYKEDTDILVINLKTDVENVIDQILSCQKTVSDSFYGLVICNAYHIPAAWVKFNERGGDYKFHDYFLSINIQCKPVSHCQNKKIDIDNIIFNDPKLKINFDCIIEFMPIDNKGWKKFLF